MRDSCVNTVILVKHGIHLRTVRAVCSIKWECECLLMGITASPPSPCQGPRDSMCGGAVEG